VRATPRRHRTSITAGQIAAALSSQFRIAGHWLTSIHVLFLLSAAARALAALLSVRIQDPGARGGVPDLLRSLAQDLPRVARWEALGSSGAGAALGPRQSRGGLRAVPGGTEEAGPTA
jgi:hypothetical protein